MAIEIPIPVNKLMKLTKQQAEAIDFLKMDSRYPIDRVIKINMRKEFTGRLTFLNNFTIDEIVRIFYYGYELSQTPEEQIQELYKEISKRISTDKNSFAKQKVKLMLQILDILDKKIEGVNM